MWMMLAALVAMETVMATQLEISEDMARRLGRASLVADYNGGDFTPKPLFQNLINDAHEWLDLNYRPERPMEELEVALAAGQADFSVGGIKWVNSMALAGEPRQQLYYVEYGDLKRLRGVLEPGIPKYWARQPRAQHVLHAPEFGLEFEPTTVTFDSETGLFGPFLPGKWGIGSVEGRITWTGNSFLWDGGENGDVVYFRLPSSAPVETEVVLTFTGLDPSGEISVMVGGYVVDFQGNYATASDIGSPVFEVNETLDSSLSFTLPAGTNFFIIQLANVTAAELTDASIGYVQSLPSLPVPWFSLAPATSQARSLFVLGSRYSPRMAANSDETWWSATHPAILKKAIRREVESELNRNQGEVEKIELELRKQLRQLENNEVFERSRGDADDWRIMP